MSRCCLLHSSSPELSVARRSLATQKTYITVGSRLLRCRGANHHQAARLKGPLGRKPWGAIGASPLGDLFDQTRQKSSSSLADVRAVQALRASGFPVPRSPKSYPITLRPRPKRLDCPWSWAHAHHRKGWPALGSPAIGASEQEHRTRARAITQAGEVAIEAPTRPASHRR